MSKTTLEDGENASREKTFPIVAIGASAGGLEAITQLLQNLPPDTGMAFIYVQHLSPTHESILPSLLAKNTKMKVKEVKNRVRIEPDILYVMPPDKEMNVTDGHIRLTTRPKLPLVNLPIDLFFTSLAEKHKENVIGIILSGSATDGTQGMKAIKHEGGLTFAQDDTAKFGSMPRSAIAAGAVDFVLSPQNIALELARLSKHSHAKLYKAKTGNGEEIDDNDPYLKTILTLLHKVSGVDFSQYKMATIKRRILRRMLLYKIESLAEYAQLLKEKNDEPDILYQDLLINVTCFFRDTETHQYLKTTLLPKLLKNKKADDPLRIWVSACSSGEEAYSIAIALLEIQDGKQTAPVQIFATDLDKQAIDKARIGKYSKNEVAAVSPKRLQRFYTRSDDNYRIAKAVRDMCVFATHNILSDPPFAHVDLICCCNLFIYLDTGAQKKAIATFHYALNDGGFLMLGKSETIGSSAHLFNCINKKFKIYSRQGNSGVRKLPLSPSRLAHHTLPQTSVQKKIETNISIPDDLDKTIDSYLLSHCMPASVTINQQMEILQFRGTSDLYLSPQQGKATLNILKMTRPEIAFELRSAISKAFKTMHIVRKSGIEIRKKAALTLVSLEAVPFNSKEGDPLLLILFTEQEQAEMISVDPPNGKSNSLVKDRRIKKLEEELAASRADMQAFIQEQELFNQELQSANEEVVSSNEELQSLNEELETSKEEIESANEELSSTNQELQTRNELLNEAYNYSEAIISTMHEPMLVLDKDLLIKTANRAFYKKFAISQEQAEGRLLFDIGETQWNIPELRKLLEDLIPKKSDFYDYEMIHTFPIIGERTLVLNAKRIVQYAHSEQLILLAIKDITEIRAKGAALFAKEVEVINEIAKRFSLIADSMPQKVWTADADGKLNYFNRQWLEYTGLSFEELCNTGWEKIVHPDDWKENKKKWQQSIDTGQEYELEQRLLNKQGKYTWHLSRGMAYKQENGNIEMWIGTNTEIEKQKKQKEELEDEVSKRTYELQKTNIALEQKNIELEKANKELETFTFISSHDLQEPLRKINMFAGRLLDDEHKHMSIKGKSYLHRMIETTTRMRTLILDLLSYSRVKNTEHLFENTDLKIIMREALDDFKEMIYQSGAVIEVHGLCEATVIRFQFRQLMHNLISNALKFSHPKRTLYIDVKSTILPGSKLNVPHLLPEINYCHMTFADNGIGFDPQYKNRIFEVFQRLHGQEKYDGTGIGLAICKRIVENHKGIITATGTLNEGTTFDIYIPAT